MAMPKFSANAPCTKCGIPDPKTRYVPYRSAQETTTGKAMMEHMERTCRSCGFTWNELPADK